MKRGEGEGSRKRETQAEERGKGTEGRTSGGWRRLGAGLQSALHRRRRSAAAAAGGRGDGG